MEATDPLFDLNVPLEALGLSPVGGEAAAEKLPLLDESGWRCKTANKAQKQSLLSYAAERGMQQIGHSDLDSDLALVPYNNRIVSVPASINSRAKQITPDQFKAMCDAYAARPA